MKVLTTFCLVVVVSLTGCYHAQVTTGLTPGTVVIDKPFASGWIYGLVPPDAVEAASECSDGVARVETKLSFVNQLVSGLTFGIYAPMHITVTCAAAASAERETELRVADGASSEDVRRTFETAADVAVTSGETVYVRFAPSQP